MGDIILRNLPIEIFHSIVNRLDVPSLFRLALVSFGSSTATFYLPPKVLTYLNDASQSCKSMYDSVMEDRWIWLYAVRRSLSETNAALNSLPLHDMEVNALRACATRPRRFFRQLRAGSGSPGDFTHLVAAAMQVGPTPVSGEYTSATLEQARQGILDTETEWTVMAENGLLPVLNQGEHEYFKHYHLRLCPGGRWLVNVGTKMMPEGREWYLFIWDTVHVSPLHKESVTVEDGSTFPKEHVRPVSIYKLQIKPGTVAVGIRGISAAGEDMKLLVLSNGFEPGMARFV